MATQIEGSTALELTWTLHPDGHRDVHLCLGSGDFLLQTRPPRNAMEIYAVGKQWMWKFQHQEGQREINELHVPAGRDVRMIMTSQDVIHSFFVPAFRIKADVLPGRYTSTWFHATVPGRYHLFCSQYCGTQHSGMVGEVVVMEPAAYEQWAAGGSMARWPGRAKRLSAVRMLDVPPRRLPGTRSEPGGTIRQAGAAG